MLARLVVCMGGRVAEERIFGKDNVTSGASSDVQQATSLARQMVTKYAMSDKVMMAQLSTPSHCQVGPVLIDEREPMSSATRQLIESEVKILLQV